MITTVKGDITSDSIKYVLPHEHLFSDLRPLVDPIDDEDFYKPLCLSNYGKVSRNPYAVLDNALIGDVDTVINEVNHFKKAGGSLIADVTTSDFGRDANLLLEVSEKTGVHIVAGCGNYVDGSVSEEIKSFSKDQIKEIILADLTRGIADTGIRAGVIGEIGTGMCMSDFEKKSLCAASEAQAETGYGMHIHACLWNREGLNALSFAVKNGANPQKICVDHVDVLLDEDYIMGILDMGAYAEFDDFGKEFYVDRKNRNLLLGSFASDKERVLLIKKLIEKGYVRQILITNDICLKSMTHTYGGWGYDHVITNIIPMMQDFGISDKDIDIMMKENPIRFLERG